MTSQVAKRESGLMRVAKCSDTRSCEPRFARQSYCRPVGVRSRAFTAPDGEQLCGCQVRFVVLWSVKKHDQ